jgi:hypothetical protein
MSNVRMTISIPEDIKEQMDAIGGQIDWSAVAVDAFLSVLQTFAFQAVAGPLGDEPLLQESRRYRSLPLVGGPKDGQAVRVRVAKDGSIRVQMHRDYKLRGGKHAWYHFNAEQFRYDFSGTKE